MIEVGDEYYRCVRCGTDYERKPCTCPICKRPTRWFEMTKCGDKNE